MAEHFGTVDDYIASFPVEVQQVLQQVRRTIHAAAPGLEEAISYGIPTMRRDGRYLVYSRGGRATSRSTRCRKVTRPSPARPSSTAAARER